MFCFLWFVRIDAWTRLAERVTSVTLDENAKKIAIARSLCDFAICELSRRRDEFREDPSVTRSRTKTTRGCERCTTRRRRENTEAGLRWTGCTVGPPSHRRQTFRLQRNNRGSFPADLPRDVIWISRGTKEVAVTMRYMATRFSERRILYFVYATWLLGFRPDRIVSRINLIRNVFGVSRFFFPFCFASWRRVKFVVSNGRYLKITLKLYCNRMKQTR